MISSLRLPSLFVTLCALLTACGDEPLPVLDGPTLPYDRSAFVVPPSQADASNPEGHWPKALRSVGMDHEDILVIRNTATEVNGKLGKVTFNLPLLSRITNQMCEPINRAPMIEPKAVLTQELAQLRQEGLELDEVIVNVELLTPKRTGIHHACLTGFGPSFFNPEHRAHVLRALRELAEVDEVSAVTVGVDLNAYYHLKDLSTERSYRWDYANLVTLYQEAYDEMKAVNSELMIGPGFSWDLILNRTLPQVAEELELSLEVSQEKDLALEVSLQRTVWSALVTSTGELKADFVGVSLTPNPSEAPFMGNVLEEQQPVINAHYEQVALMGAPLHPVDRSPLELLPLAFPQVNWAQGGKHDALARMKIALHHIQPLFVSWLRLSDLPTMPESNSICRIFTNDPKSYPESFCSAGLFRSSGAARDAWELFTTDPE